MFDVNGIKKRFPSLVNNPDVIFFDNGATAQKPNTVLETVNDYYINNCVNTGRSSYRRASRITSQIEQVRKKVGHFINASNVNEVVFTSGATESLNTIVYSWALHHLKEGDQVMLCPTDHRSFVLPWIHVKNILKKFGIHIELVLIQADKNGGDYEINDLVDKVSSRTKLICLTDIHSVYGVNMKVAEIRKRVGDEVIISVDASQSVGHKKVDTQALKADFISFSGHKMFTETGIGVLWVNERIHSQLHPFKIGGGYPGAVDWDLSTVEIGQMPKRLESGTLNISGILSLGTAIDFINEIGLDNIQSHLEKLTKYFYERLQEINLEIEFLPGPIFCKKAVAGYGIISFNIRGVNPTDVGFVLDENDILVRTGSHCISNEDSEHQSIRVSLHIYNSIEEIDRFIEVLIENF